VAKQKNPDMFKQLFIGRHCKEVAKPIKLILKNLYAFAASLSVPEIK
jgi:hypothetical protein